MGQPASTGTGRKRRALAVLRKAPGLNAIPAAGVSLVGFRAPTPAERARGKAYGARAAELLAKRRKLAEAK